MKDSAAVSDAFTSVPYDEVNQPGETEETEDNEPERIEETTIHERADTLVVFSTVPGSNYLDAKHYFVFVLS